MEGFIKHIILRDKITEEAIENKKEQFACKEDDGNIKFEINKINDFTLEYRFYATNYQIDISGYGFWIDCTDNKVDIEIYNNGKEMYEYYTRKTLLDGKLFIEVFADVPTQSRKTLKIVLKRNDKKKIKVLEVYRRLAVYHNKYMFIENK